MNLQQRITHHAMEAFNYLDLEVGALITKKEAHRLLDAGMDRAFCALQILYTRHLAALQDRNLREDAPSYEVCDALAGLASGRTLIEYGAGYFVAMHNLMSGSERQEMFTDLQSALHQNVPYVSDIVKLIKD